MARASTEEGRPMGALLARYDVVGSKINKSVLPKGEDGGKKYNSSGAVGRAALAAALRKMDNARKQRNNKFATSHSNARRLCNQGLMADA